MKTTGAVQLHETHSGTDTTEVLESRLERRSSYPSLLFSFGIVVFIIGLVCGPLRLFSPNGVPFISSFGQCTVVAALLVLAAIYSNRGSARDLTFASAGFALGLILLVASDWFHRRYNFFPDAAVRGEIFILSLISLFFLRRNFEAFLGISAVLAPLLLTWCFVTQANGALIFSDDHPSMLYRLALLREHFPNLPFYTPLWNAGIEARDFFATGILNVFLIFAPLIYSFDLATSYNTIVVLVVFFLVPFAGYGAARLSGIRPLGGLVCSLLMLTTNLFWYRWCLKYGALGFITAASLVPLNIALAGRVFAREGELCRMEALLLVLSVTLMLCWTPTGLALLPVLFLGLVQVKRVLKKRHVPLVLALLITINLPWILIFISVSDVGTFIETNHRSAETRLEGTFASSEQNPDMVAGNVQRLRPARLMQALRDVTIATNPLLFLLFLPGLFALKRSNIRLLFSLIIPWLLVLGVILAPLKPQLELDRMLLILCLVLSVPTASAIVSLLDRLQTARDRKVPLIAASLVSGVLLSGVFSVGAILSNRTVERYHFADETVPGLTRAISEHGGDGRTLFSGFVLHEWSNGHLAPLATFTRRPLIASYFTHKHWRYIDVVPEEYRTRGEEGIEAFFDLMNATSVVTHERVWADYCLTRPDRYEQVWRGKRFRMFKRTVNTGGYFLQGSGMLLEQSSNRIGLQLHSPDAVIKFNYASFLESTACLLEPFAVSRSQTVIKLSGCPIGKEIVIQAKPIWRRLLSEW